jgi:nucleoside-diphosphate-sugar epimerase
MPDKPMLITGGAGFVGRHVVWHVLRNKIAHEIWIVDNLFTGRHPDEWLLPQGFKRLEIGSSVEYRRDQFIVFFLRMDVRDFFRRALEFPFSRTLPRFGDVIHLASIVGGRALIEGDPLLVALDLSIDAEMFMWARVARPDRILYVSSSAAYPIQLQDKNISIPLKEEFIDFQNNLGMPDLTYGWSKLTGEYLARIAAQHYNLHVTCVRPFSGYGEDQELTYPIPAIASRVAKREDPLIIWGTGEQGRDFVHIDDCVELMFLAMEHISDGSAINIGSGVLTTFRQIAEMLARIAGYCPTIKPLIEKPSGVHSRYADMTLVQRKFGWRPKISLEEGLTRVYQSMLEKLNSGGLS